MFKNRPIIYAVLVTAMLAALACVFYRLVHVNLVAAGCLAIGWLIQYAHQRLRKKARTGSPEA